MNGNEIIPISNFQLALSVILVLLAGSVSALLRLGLLKSLLWGTVRTFVQLFLIGYALTYIFNLNSPPVIFAIILIMCAIATHAATRRSSNVPDYPKAIGFLSLTASTFLVGGIVVGLIITPEPWYSARTVVPIFGMILGNSMNGIALSLDRLYSETRSHIAEIESLLSFGATPWEAMRERIKEALRAGMTPTINSLMVVGLVSLPGMMTGQILGGADPREAVRYQIVVMLMIAAAVAVGCLMLVLLSYKHLFTEDAALNTTKIKVKQ
ncbi:ABC transporter permease [Desulfoscipio geothermicus]|uniref:Putative ABC transport system permease protein n=1 Tax=Desulfoscipio geothermicus DSM 3669 TaxID=1121426 RepID=A0A1I6DY71_9FIRM|nr:iron export ABC transporter permease subunit FetB [Desulfoscipio geothermicus]SFR10238.1 putative ABC transport system permease protein [Desulfoscipio geothermicus DSM 3669]